MLGQTKKSASIRKSAKLPKLNIQQHIENQQIADRMNRKITFARNPRHLTQTMSYANAFVSESQQTKFRVDPQQLYFSNYDVMHIYESQVKLINNSKYIQRIKVTPLKQKQFVLADIRYPRQDCGDIAPGMSVTITIRFRPASLSDYQDDLFVIVGDGVVKVPIIAQRERCQINWPKTIACGHCWVGDVIRKEVVLKNKGGDAEFLLVNSDGGDRFKLGYFTVIPTTLNFEKNTQKTINIEFVPEKQGVFKQSIKYKSFQGDQDEIEIILEGGAYSAQIVLQELNGQKLLQQRMHNILYIKDTEMGKNATASLKIRNLAVVQVDYFWHFVSKNLSIDKTKGKMKPSEILPVELNFNPLQKIPQNVTLQLYLFNLPQKSLSANLVTKNINGIEAIQCLTIEIKTKPSYSNIDIFPLHREIIQPIFQNCAVQQYITIANYSTVTRAFRIDKIKIDQGLNATPLELEGVLEPNSSKNIIINFYLESLTSSMKNVYFLVSFDNAQSKIFSICGKSTYPDLIFKEQILYFGLCKTFTLNKKKLTFKNLQKTPVQFKIHNKNRFYVLQFYDFYEFQDEQSYKRRFNVYNPVNGKQILDWCTIPPQSQVHLDCLLNVLEEDSIELQIQLQIKNGKKTQIKIIAEVQDVQMEMSRSLISLRQIYKGNVYNSNKFLSKQLQVVNNGNHDCAFEIIQPTFEECQIKIQPKTGVIKSKSTQRIDMILQPIKTGDFDLRIKWNYYDDFKSNPDLYLQQAQTCKFNSIDGGKSLIKHNELQITGTIKGMAMNYYLKDESRVKKVRVKIQDIPQSVKLSSSSFNPSMSMKSNKNLLQNQKLVYPVLEELNFYNCQINQVRQVQIIIQNDSGLTTEYEVYAQQYRTLQKFNQFQRKNQKGLVKVDEQPFTSQMGKTYIKSKALDRSQKVHLGNNKGISVLCEPSGGALHKKQTQKILITMFNDTSGRFKDNLIINVKNHQIKKIPMDIHIKGTPVSLSRNQLGIDFNQQIPFMNLGTLLHSNGLIKRNIKVVNNGPKEVQLKWLIYPYNKINRDKYIFNIEFKEAAPGNGNIIDLNWNAIKPEIDQSSYLSLQPKQKKVKGREQINFTVLIQEIKQVGHFSNLLICQPLIIDGANRTPMQSLAVVVTTETINPQLTMDVKHKNHINKLQKFAIPHQQYQTNANNFIRKLKLKNTLKTNLTFDISISSKDTRFQSFKILQAKTNSPATNLLATNNQKSFSLTYDSIVEVTVELLANSSNLNEWPMEEKVRKQGEITVSFSNGSKQTIQLAGWLYRPWLVIQMPNQKLFSNQNFQIDFGTVHFKNSKKLSFYLLNPSKVDAKYTISYIKYHQSIKYKFQQTLWTALDYEDQTITDEKKCWKLSVDSGIVKNRSIPVHYMPATLALPSSDDQFAQTHKPQQVTIMFKPQANVLYKSKFRLSVAQGLTFDIVVKGKGSYEEELEKK